MVTEAILICVLALPSHLKGNYQLLVDFMKTKMPDYEIVLVDLDYSGPVKGYKWTPLFYEGQQVYLKRVKGAS